MTSSEVLAYARKNRLGLVGLASAGLAVLCLDFPVILAMEVAFGTIALLATFLGIVLCLVSLVREPSKVPGFAGILAILLGETYKLPLILINAFTLLVFYLPYLLIVVLVAVLARYIHHRMHARHTTKLT